MRFECRTDLQRILLEAALEHCRVPYSTGMGPNCLIIEVQPKDTRRTELLLLDAVGSFRALQNQISTYVRRGGPSR